MKKKCLKSLQNENGHIFPLTSLGILLLLLFTFHQIQQIYMQKQVQQLNEEQFKLEMLYQKAYRSILIEDSPPPYQYTFPDGTIDISLSSEENNKMVYRIQLETNTGGFRQIFVDIPS
ncbi:hypothetical protein SH601_08340 [Gracilibacillus sp. S3-1-1]|uniref:Uncharacterized protein n=1 Tax=Gracilibacillus pellucidus TaxID=3095368 RepID=A0ACC6M4U7_9BACI|nr:hypothetical protein [Gracilibacillus sp. S3-1-1]MDX8045996.1 hypothetical protein [Gracilibacillus sp. S3-1-1]